MPIFVLTISSKNNQSLINFLYFLLNNSKIYFFNNYKKKKIKKKIITTLKSPHVNKTAQEQYEIRIFSISLLISSFNFTKCLIVLKKIKHLLFPDVKLNIKLLINNISSFQTKIKLFNIRNYKIIYFKKVNFIYQRLNSNYLKIVKNKTYKKYKLQRVKKTKHYLKVLDCYGESSLLF